MNKAVYQVTMSTDGKHTVTVTIEDPAGTRAALAWAQATHAQLLQQETEMDELLAEAEHELDGSPPKCVVHHVPMVRVQGQKGPFWSCHQKNADGSWCSYKPTDR
jgi:hypothetical protein